MRVSLVNLNLVAQDAIGGCLLNQARLFLRRGDDVHFYVCHPPEGVPDELAARASVVTLADLISGRHPHFTLSDLYIYHYPARYPLIESIKGIERGAVVFYYHNVTPPELWSFDADRDLLVRGRAGIVLSNYADLAITDSPFNADDLVEQGGLDRNRVRVVPLAVRLEQFAPGPQDADLIRRYKLDGQRVLMFVGRMAGNKRIDLLVEALALVQARIPNVKLLLVGDCDSSPAYRDISDRARARAVELGVADSVIFTGRVEELARHYRLADVYVTASLHEGFAVPLIEAMASGVPVVAARAGAMPWVVGEAGLLCEPGQARDLAAKLCDLLQDGARHSELVRRGLERARDFTLERYEAGLLSTIAEIMPPQVLSDVSPSTLESGSTPRKERARFDALAKDITDLAVECDVALRDYAVRSHVPLVGSLIAWVRRNLTSHLREPYLDPIIERQVKFNYRATETLAHVNDVWTARFRQVDQQFVEYMNVMDERLRQIQVRLDLLTAQVALLETEQGGNVDAAQVANVRRQVETLRAHMAMSRQDSVRPSHDSSLEKL